MWLLLVVSDCLCLSLCISLSLSLCASLSVSLCACVCMCAYVCMRLCVCVRARPIFDCVTNSLKSTHGGFPPADLYRSSVNRPAVQPTVALASFLYFINPLRAGNLDQLPNRRSSEIQVTALGKCLRAWTCICLRV